MQMCQSLPTALHLSLHLGYNRQYKKLHQFLIADAFFLPNHFCLLVLQNFDKVQSQASVPAQFCVDVPLKHVLRFILEVGNNIIDMYVDPIHEFRHHTEVGCVIDVWGEQCLHLQDQGGWVNLYRPATFQTQECKLELDLACVNRNNEQGIVTMYSFSTSTELL